MVTASTFYFDSNSDREGKANLKLGFQFAYFNNFGSIAFGSLMLTFVSIIRWTFILVAEALMKSEGAGENPVILCMVGCGKCLLSCCEQLCEYVTDQAFAYMAVSGDRFMVSAWNGFLLNLKHCMKFAFANFLAKCFIFMGKFCVVSINVGSVYLFLKYVTGDYEEI